MRSKELVALFRYFNVFRHRAAEDWFRHGTARKASRCLLEYDIYNLETTALGCHCVCASEARLTELG